VLAKSDCMPISFKEIFRNSEIFNPVSQTNLFLAGKLAKMSPNKTVIDLASGSGYPSLLWTSVFGIHVDGYDLEKKYVEYANERAKLLHLDGKAHYFCQDLTNFTPNKKYDIVAALGFDVSIFGGRIQALNRLKNMLNLSGTIILTEPNWTTKPTPLKNLKSLNLTQDSFLTITEMQKLLQEQDFREIWHVTSTKEDWEMYVRPIFITMQEYMKDHPDLALEAQVVIDNFQAEYDAAGEAMDVTLWVLKPTSN
jgi:cyclopropane fatty-acyl-phospholipid synthase-like methyltransferase